jgi:hypothetical protein
MEADARLGADAVGKDADENGGDDGEASDLFARQVLFLLQIDEAKYDRGESTWAEPPHEGDGPFRDAGSDE